MLSYDVVEWGKPLQKAEKPTPKPAGTEVLLKLKYSGVCHSDVHIREGYFNLGGGKRFHMSERGMRPPVTLGHEPFGTVIAAGPDATDAPIGQDRLVCPWIGCGKCARCTKGNRKVADVHLRLAQAAVEDDGDHDRQHQCEQDRGKVAQTHYQPRGNTVVTSLANRAEISAPSALASAIRRFSSPASPGVRPRLIGTTTRTSASSV